MLVTDSWLVYLYKVQGNIIVGDLLTLTQASVPTQRTKGDIDFSVTVFFRNTEMVDLLLVAWGPSCQYFNIR